MTKAPEKHLKTCLRELFLAHCADVLDQHLQRAQQQNLSHEQFLSTLLSDEIAHRQAKRIETRIRQARIPVIKGIEQFDFTCPVKIPKQRTLSLFNLKFIAEKKNIILVGPPGVGKTHIASALAYAACMNNIKCRFITAGTLIGELNASLADNTFLKCVKRFVKDPLLIIDELGYLTIDKPSCDLFFQIISNRYETGSMVITTNRPFSKWAEIFNGDSVLASAIIDRLIHHSEVIKIEGDSYRMKNK